MVAKKLWFCGLVVGASLTLTSPHAIGADETPENESSKDGQGAPETAPQPQQTTEDPTPAAPAAVSAPLTAQPTPTAPDSSYAAEVAKAVEALRLSIPWPATPLPGFSFKGLSLGGKVTLDKSENIYYYQDGEWDRPTYPQRPDIKCKVTYLVPFARCQSWSDFNTAFGEPITMRMDILLDRLPNKSEVIEHKIGTGRIVSFTFESSKPSADLIKNFRAVITEKFGVQPEAAVNKESGSAVSKNCIEILGSLQNKPIPKWTPADYSRQKACHSQMALAAIDGPSNGLKLRWKTGQLLASLDFKVTSGIVAEQSLNVGIGIQIEQAMRTYVATVQEINRQAELQVKAQKRQDF